MTVEHVCFHGIGYLAKVRMSKRLSIRRIVSNQVPVSVATEEQLSGCDVKSVLFPAYPAETWRCRQAILPVL